MIDTDKTGRQKPAAVSLGNERFPYDSDLDLDVGKVGVWLGLVVGVWLGLVVCV